MDDPLHISASDHRSDREDGALVYPVVSRRSGGLSVGINLFPDRKACNFDCPYCEIFPFESARLFSLDALTRGLNRFFTREYPELFSGMTIKDICMSGNGEPTASVHFIAALDATLSARDRFAPDADLVVITNSTRLGDPLLAGELGRRVDNNNVNVWAKLDAATEERYRQMNHCSISLNRIIDGIRSFSSTWEITIQSMFCRVDGMEPAAGEIDAYSGLLARLVKDGALIRQVHLYTLARRAPSGRVLSIADDFLRMVAASLRERFSSGSLALPRVRLFGEYDEIEDGSL